MVAHLVDGLLLSPLASAGVVPMVNRMTDRLQRLAVSNPDEQLLRREIEALYADLGPTLALVLGIYLAVAALYTVTLESSPVGMTVGKWLVGVQVRAAGGGPLPVGRALVRFVVEVLVSGPALLLGFLWALIDPGRRTWHDLAARSVVIEAERPGFGVLFLRDPG